MHCKLFSKVNLVVFFSYAPHCQSPVQVADNKKLPEIHLRRAEKVDIWDVVRSRCRDEELQIQLGASLPICGDSPTRGMGTVTVQMRLEGPGRPNQRLYNTIPLPGP